VPKYLLRAAYPTADVLPKRIIAFDRLSWCWVCPAGIRGRTLPMLPEIFARNGSPWVPYAAITALNVVAGATFMVLPTLVEGATQAMDFSPREVGVLSAFYMVGLVVGSLGAKYWVRRLEWRKAARATLLGMALANALSVFFHQRELFMGLQMLEGVFSGSLYSLTLTVISDGENPDRHFGIALAAQVVFQATGLYVGPSLLHMGGINAVLWALTLVLAATLGITGLIPQRGRTVPFTVSFRTLLRPATLAALTGCLCFYLNAGCYWTFIDLIGRDSGISEERIARALVIGVGAGFIGALSASWVGIKLPRIAMLWVGAVMVIVGVAILVGRVSLPAFLSSACVFSFAWNFSLAYQYAVVAASDPTGHAIAVTTAFQGTGGAAGPVLAGALITPHDFSSVLWVVVGGVVLSQIFFVVAARTSKLQC
jgi:MFS transporter, DHA1 family, inner membrane transport protein